MTPRGPGGLAPQTTIGRIELLERQVRELAALVEPDGSCDWGDCTSDAFGLRWSAEHGWLPVCPEHQEQR